MVSLQKATTDTRRSGQRDAYGFDPGMDESTLHNINPCLMELKESIYQLFAGK